MPTLNQMHRRSVATWPKAKSEYKVVASACYGQKLSVFRD